MRTLLFFEVGVCFLSPIINRGKMILLSIQVNSTGGEPV